MPMEGSFWCCPNTLQCLRDCFVVGVHVHVHLVQVTSRKKMFQKETCCPDTDSNVTVSGQYECADEAVTVGVACVVHIYRPDWEIFFFAKDEELLSSVVKEISTHFINKLVV